MVSHRAIVESYISTYWYRVDWWNCCGHRKIELECMMQSSSDCLKLQNCSSLKQASKGIA